MRGGKFSVFERGEVFFLVFWGFAGGRGDGAGGGRGAELGAGPAAGGLGFVGGEFDLFAFLSRHDGGGFLDARFSPFLQ